MASAQFDSTPSQIDLHTNLPEGTNGKSNSPFIVSRVQCFCSFTFTVVNLRLHICPSTSVPNQLQNHAE